MKKIFKGWLFNRMEKLGGKVFNHVGCEGDDEHFIDFLTQFVPHTGARRKVIFTVESKNEIEEIEDYTIAKDYTKGKNHGD
ncbi:hypothetical protein JXB02_06255 [Candidatus Woesearchaeota archaeon]|nr:hypothetical protein [Candidatus Woesearchaeota archaeon]